MQILADRVIANAAEAFSKFGDVTLFDGRDLNPAMLERADVLLIRSVTKVDADLLKSTPVKFVGTATAGIDHVNAASLRQANITFASAPGCNANAVAEFIATSVITFCVKEKLKAESTQVAIVGHGAVGTRVEHKLQSLGFGVVLNDPIKAQDNKTNNYVALDAALQADIVTLHTPLTVGGAHPSYRLIDTPQINAMSNCRLLINAARGGIVNEDALAERLLVDSQFNAQLDCWETEPHINQKLIGQLFRSSPHVAGHSIEARENATNMLVESLRNWLESELSRGVVAAQSSATKPEIEQVGVIDPSTQGVIEFKDSFYSFERLLGHCCPIDEINSAMLALADVSKQEAGSEFDRLRRQFAGRREFTAYQIPIELCGRFTHNSLRELGFRVA